MDEQQWEGLTREQKSRLLYEKQKQLLALFLKNGAISQAQHDRSLGDLKRKMHITDEDPEQK